MARWNRVSEFQQHGTRSDGRCARAGYCLRLGEQHQSVQMERTRRGRQSDSWHTWASQLGVFSHSNACPNVNIYTDRYFHVNTYNYAHAYNYAWVMYGWLGPFIYSYQ